MWTVFIDERKTIISELLQLSVLPLLKILISIVVFEPVFAWSAPVEKFGALERANSSAMGLKFWAPALNFRCWMTSATQVLFGAVPCERAANFDWALTEGERERKKLNQTCDFHLTSLSLINWHLLWFKTVMGSSMRKV
jgi:hypothetical protein